MTSLPPGQVDVSATREEDVAARCLVTIGGSLSVTSPD